MFKELVLCFVFPGVFLELPAGSASDQVVDGVDQPVLSHGVAPGQLDNWTLTHIFIIRQLNNTTLTQFNNWAIGQLDTQTIGQLDNWILEMKNLNRAMVKSKLES